MAKAMAYGGCCGLGQEVEIGSHLLGPDLELPHKISIFGPGMVLVAEVFELIGDRYVATGETSTPKPAPMFDPNGTQHANPWSGEFLADTGQEGMFDVTTGRRVPWLTQD